MFVVTLSEAWADPVVLLPVERSKPSRQSNEYDIQLRLRGFLYAVDATEFYFPAEPAAKPLSANMRGTAWNSPVSWTPRCRFLRRVQTPPG